MNIELDAVCDEVEVRKCIIKAMCLVRGWDVDVEEEFTYVELSDSIDGLDEDATAIVSALAENGYLSVPAYSQQPSV